MHARKTISEGALMRRETLVVALMAGSLRPHAETGKPVRCAIVSVRGMGQAGPELPNRQLGDRPRAAARSSAAHPPSCRRIRAPARGSDLPRQRFSPGETAREPLCGIRIATQLEMRGAHADRARKFKGSVGPRLRAIWKHSIASTGSSRKTFASGAVPGPDAATVECEGALEMGLRRRLRASVREAPNRASTFGSLASSSAARTASSDAFCLSVAGCWVKK